MNLNRFKLLLAASGALLVLCLSALPCQAQVVRITRIEKAGEKYLLTLDVQRGGGAVLGAPCALKIKIDGREILAGQGLIKLFREEAAIAEVRMNIAFAPDTTNYFVELELTPPAGGADKKEAQDHQARPQEAFAKKLESLKSNAGTFTRFVESVKKEIATLPPPYGPKALEELGAYETLHSDLIRAKNRRDWKKGIQCCDGLLAVANFDDISRLRQEFKSALDIEIKNARVLEGIETLLNASNWVRIEEALKALNPSGLTPDQNTKVENAQAMLTLYIRARNLIAQTGYETAANMPPIEKDLDALTPSVAVRDLENAVALLSQCRDKAAAQKVEAAKEQLENSPAMRFAKVKKAVRDCLDREDWLNLEMHLILVSQDQGSDTVDDGDKAYFQNAMNAYRFYLEGRSALRENPYLSVQEMARLDADLKQAMEQFSPRSFTRRCEQALEKFNNCGAKQSAQMVSRALEQGGLKALTAFCTGLSQKIQAALTAKQIDEIRRLEQKMRDSACSDGHPDLLRQMDGAADVLSQLDQADKYCQEGDRLWKNGTYDNAAKQFREGFKIYSRLGYDKQAATVSESISVCETYIKKEKQVVNALSSASKRLAECSTEQCCTELEGDVSLLKKSHPGLLNRPPFKDRAADLSRKIATRKEAIRKKRKQKAQKNSLKKEVKKLEAKAGSCLTVKCCEALQWKLSRLKQKSRWILEQHGDLKKIFTAAHKKIETRIKTIRQEAQKTPEKTGPRELPSNRKIPIEEPRKKQRVKSRLHGISS